MQAYVIFLNLHVDNRWPAADCLSRGWWRVRGETSSTLCPLLRADEGLVGAPSPDLVDDLEETRAPICRSRCCREFKSRDDYGRREGVLPWQRLQEGRDHITCWCWL